MDNPNFVLVQPLCDVDPVSGALPEDLHHTRGRTGALRDDPRYLIGLARATHGAQHDQGKSKLARARLFDQLG